jgi:hypothetical protein
VNAKYEMLGADAVTSIAHCRYASESIGALFGRVPEGGELPEPFDLYSMQQAIEEGFILDVLQNYTPTIFAFWLMFVGCSRTYCTSAFTAVDSSTSPAPS